MPIDIVTGSVSLEVDDIVLPGRVPLVWSARYSMSNLERVRTPLGRGWCGSAFCTLSYRDGTFAHVTERGSEELFHDPTGVVAAGGVVRNLGAYLEIFRDRDRIVVRSWDVTSDTIRDLCFVPEADGPWPLSAIEDPSGDGIDLIWQGGSGVRRLFALRQRVEQREVLVGYDGDGWLESLAVASNDAVHRLVTYEHDANGNLVEIADAARFADRFEYDALGRPIREVMKDGGVFHYRYDPAGRCVLHTGLGHYNERRLRYLPAIRTTEVADSYGHVTTHQYGSTGQVVAEIDPLGGRRLTDYDEHGRIVASTDASGAVVRYGYDEHGNRSMVNDQVGARISYRYNRRHQPVEMIDANGQVWRRSYDAMARLESAVDALGDQWSYHYDDSGNLVEVHNPLGAQRTMGYERGILRSFSDWMGNITERRVDALGREVARRGPHGEQTRIRYDPVGNPVEVTLPDGTKFFAAYDRAGNLTSHVDAAGRTTRWRFGPCGRLLEHVDAAGGALHYLWGTEPARLKKVVNQKGEEHTFEYDEAGRIVAETGFDGAVRRYVLDPEGRTTTYLNANGEALAIVRDGLGRIVEQNLPDGEQLKFVYDPRGDLAAASSGDISLRYERDALGRVVLEFQGSRWVRTAYDAVGGVLQVQASDGYQVDYDVDANSAVVATTISGLSTRYRRDGYGREVQRGMPGGSQLTVAYDALGRLIGQRLDARATSSSPTIGRAYRYDVTSALVQTSDNRWGAADYAYNPIDQLVGALRARGNSERFDYDRTGNITRVRTEGPRLRDETLLYGPGDRLIRHADTLLEFDAEGRCIRRVEDTDGAPPLEWRYAWNALDRLKSVTEPDGTTWTYRYDPLARRTAKCRDGKVVAEFLWDREVVAQELVAGEESRNWFWDTDSFAPIATQQSGRLFNVVNDQVGCPRELVGEDGRVALALLYDSWGMVTNVEQSDVSAPSCSVRFQGQWYDAESGLHYNLHRYYDPSSGRYVSSDPIGLEGGTNAFRYGTNPLAWIDPLGLCNGNSKSSTRAQHGYVIVDTHAVPPIIAKIGISGRPLNQNGTSPRANNQANRWNREPGNAGRYVPVVVQQIPTGTGARQNILTWESNNAAALRSAGHLDPTRHKRP